MTPPGSEYFERFLARYRGRPLLDGYEGVTATFSIRFRDTGEVWGLEIRNGQIDAVAAVADPRGDAWFEVESPVFWEIVSGRTSPQAAFFARRTSIHGNLVLGMRLAKILGMFFARYPYPYPDTPTP
jgi:predicted lipid carrier protein YhbT